MVSVCVPTRSMTNRAVASPGCTAALNPPNRGPGSTAIVVVSTTRTSRTKGAAVCNVCGGNSGDGVSRASASNLMRIRSPSCVTVLLARGVASMVSRPAAPSESYRTRILGTRRSPTMSRREAFRKSRRAS